MIAEPFVSMSEPEIAAATKRKAPNAHDAKPLPARLGRHSRGPLFIPWQCINDFVPGGFGTDENVFAGTHTRITIDSSQYHFGDFSGIAESKRGAALPAKAPLFSR